MEHEVIIIGGGLAGLTTAYLLKKRGIKALIIEANDRLGGRIYSKSSAHRQFELGATWVFDDPELKQLLSELGLQIYQQYLEGDALIKYDPSMEMQKRSTNALMNGAVYHKIKGGTGAIIRELENHVGTAAILLNTKVEAINATDIGITIKAANGSIFSAKSVIVTVPPKSLASHIEITPALTNHDIMESTHTWMGDSAKFTAWFDQDYWRKSKHSGFLFSNYGLIREMQDHSSDAFGFGLVGFIQPTSDLINDFEKRRKAAILEFTEIFNIREENVLAYDDFIWGDYFQDVKGRNHNVGLMPHQNNGHPIYLSAHLDHRLFFAGAETSPTNPGYMEGAVKSAFRAVNLLLK